MGWRHSVTIGEAELTTVPLTPDRLPDLDLVMGERGVARRCYCMHWRRPDGGYGDQRDNRERFAEVASNGPPPGLLAYLDGEPVGWVQVGPRDDFPTIRRSRLLQPVDDVDPWSINCFVVRAGRRRNGIGRGLLAAAIAYAGDQGARIIEAYPVDGERSSAVDYFTGTLAMFDEHGFTEVLRRNESRPIVRLTV